MMKFDLLRQWSSARNGQIIQTLLVLFIALLTLPLISANMNIMAAGVEPAIEGRDHGGDFIVFYAAGKLYATNHDASPYDLDRLRAAELEANPTLKDREDWTANRANPFRNIPAFLPLLAFFAGFSLPTGFALSALYATLLIGAVIALSVMVATARARPIAGLALVVLFFLFEHVWTGIVYGQLATYIIVLSFVLGILLLRGGHGVMAGLVLALLILKMQYLLPVFVFLLVLREWRALLGLITGAASLVLVSLALVGWDGMLLYAQTTITLTTAPAGLYFANFRHMFNWRGLLENLFSAGPTEVIFIGQIVLILITYAIAIWSWRRMVAEGSERGDWRWSLGVLVLATTMILASPHAHSQDLVILIPALSFSLGHLWRSNLPWPVLPLSFLVTFLLFWTIPHYIWAGPGLSVLLIAGMFAVAVVAVQTTRFDLTWELGRSSAQAAEPDPTSSLQTQHETGASS